MFVYDTVSQALNGLKNRGYTIDFNLEENCLVCEGSQFEAEDFEIVEIYRFEGTTNPSDEAIVYAIESKNGIKGVLLNAYGIYADPLSEKMAKKLSIAEKNKSQVSK